MKNIRLPQLKIQTNGHSAIKKINKFDLPKISSQHIKSHSEYINEDSQAIYLNTTNETTQDLSLNTHEYKSPIKRLSTFQKKIINSDNITNTVESVIEKTTTSKNETIFMQKKNKMLKFLKKRNAKKILQRIKLTFLK